MDNENTKNDLNELVKDEVASTKKLKRYKTPNYTEKRKMQFEKMIADRKANGWGSGEKSNILTKKEKALVEYINNLKLEKPIEKPVAEIKELTPYVKESKPVDIVKTEVKQKKVYNFI